MTRENDIRKEILLQTYALLPLAVSATRIQRDAKKSGYDFTLTEIQRGTVFLCDTGLLLKLEDKAGSEPLYRITAAGMTDYEQNCKS